MSNRGDVLATYQSYLDAFMASDEQAIPRMRAVALYFSRSRPSGEHRRIPLQPNRPQTTKGLGHKRRARDRRSGGNESRTIRCARNSGAFGRTAPR
jgi:hypothetical protein